MDIIILGAGASKSDGLPLQNEFFIDYIKNYSGENFSKEIIDFFYEFWGIRSNSDLYSSYLPTFEECLGILDWAHLRAESFKGYTIDKIDNIRNSLLFLIARILDEYLTDKTKNHKKLLIRLDKDNQLENTSFISLNYDVIMDRVISGFNKKYAIRYGFNTNENGSKDVNTKSIALYKLHGSLNWLYCPTCIHIKVTATSQKAVNAFYQAEQCSQCGTPVRPIIIPPTLYKEMSNPFIHQIFLKCDQVLRSADRIFFCGYSFPESDMHIKYLLKRAELYNNSTPEIHIINFYKGKNDIEEEKKRFLRFFNNKDRVFYHSDLTFEDFAKNGL